MPPSAIILRSILVLFAISGMASLMYEVLWLKDMRGCWAVRHTARR